VSAFMGWPIIQQENGFVHLLIWIGCVFISILVHELGHVFMGRFFGTDGHIVLYSFGGLAIGSNQLGNRWQRIAVCIAGPLAGFLLLAVIFLGLGVSNPELARMGVESIKYVFDLPIDQDAFHFPPTLADKTIQYLVWINLFWGLLNLMPIWPLDGGQISRDLFSAFLGNNGVRVALRLSVVVAALLALQSLAATYGKAPLP